MNVRHFLRCISATWGEWNTYIVASCFRSRFDSGAAAKHDQIGDGNIFGKRLLDTFQHSQNPLQFFRFIDLPVSHGFQSNSGSVSSSALVGIAVSGGRGPGSGYKSAGRQSTGENHCFEFHFVCRIDRRRFRRWQWILPELRWWDFRTQAANVGSHVAVRQFVPRLRKRFAKQCRVFVELFGNDGVLWIHTERQVRCKHHRSVRFGGIVSIWNRASSFPFLGDP
mmetsp:Transcript_27464/g.75069  ORF Transcript_27464/g.75069 Transcript_27464/m.75069 type:complete len:224 (+) Transcript_27464:705-1376(+)